MEFLLPGVSEGFSATQVSVAEETSTIVAEAQDADIFGGGNLDDAGGLSGTPSVDAEWAYEMPGLWDIASSGDLTTVAAISASEEIPPHIGVVQSGAIAWEQPLDDAAEISVDVSVDGQYIAVGCAHT